MIVTLTPRADFSPVPRIELRLSPLDVVDGGTPAATGSSVLGGGTPSATGLVMAGGSVAQVTVDVPAETETVTVWRRNEGSGEPVQGVKGRRYNGQFGVVDFAPPPNATSEYEIECFAQGSSIARLPAGSTFLSADMDASDVIVQHPMNPRLHVVVRNMAGSWPQISRDAPGEDVFVEGHDLPVFVGFGPLRGIDGLVVDFEAGTRDVARRVWATLGTRDAQQLPIWLIRAPNRGLLPEVFYGRISRLSEVGVTVNRGDGRGGKSRFRATLRQTRQPAPSLAAPLLSYSDLAVALGGTYSGIAARLPRYSDWSTAWEYAGAAG